MTNRLFGRFLRTKNDQENRPRDQENRPRDHNTGSAMHAHLYGHFSLLMDNYELVFNDLDTNAIQTTSISLPDANTYNLLGRRLMGKPNRKGIYIQNGRKVVVK